MFDKKNKNKGKTKQEELSVKKEEEFNKKVSESVEIHTMPRSTEKNISSGISPTKKAGLVIIGGGALLLILMAVGFYYILFSYNRNSDSKVAEPEQAISQKQVNKEPEQAISQKSQEEDSGSLLPTEEDIATSTQEIATTTNEEPEFEIQPTEESQGTSDKDQDGLFDKEELILGSNLEEIDTDGDGYGDLSEVLNLYDPAGSGLLKDNENIQEFKSDVYGYSILYPANWDFNMIGSAGDSLVIKSKDNHFFRLIVEPNPNLQSIENWYKKQFEVDVIKKENIENTSLWQGIRSDDGLILYLTDLNRNYIFILSYTPVGESLDYKNLFEMMIKSFSI